MSANLPLFGAFYEKVHLWLQVVMHDPLDDEAYPLLPLEEPGPSEAPRVGAVPAEIVRQRKRSAVEKFFTEVQL